MFRQGTVGRLRRCKLSCVPARSGEVWSGGSGRLCLGEFRPDKAVTVGPAGSGRAGCVAAS